MWYIYCSPFLKMAQERLNMKCFVIHKPVIGYCSLFVLLSHLFALLTLVVPARGSKENWRLFHHVVPVWTMYNKVSASTEQSASCEPTSGYSSPSGEYINKSGNGRSICYLCMPKALLLLWRSSSAFCIRVVLTLPLYWYFHGLLSFYINYRVFLEKRPIMWDGIIFGHCGRE